LTLTPDGLVDCHSHVVPSGDDGVATVEEGLSLCAEAARRGTRMLFATPHVSGEYPLTTRREQRLRRAHDAMQQAAALDLRLGFEVAADSSFLRADPLRYAIEGIDAVLLEAPFADPLDDLIAAASHAEAAGLTPLIAHPERSYAICNDRALASELSDRGWILQISAGSLAGTDGRVVEATAWALVMRGVEMVIGSDGHNLDRPPYLDAAFHLVLERAPSSADPCFKGASLDALCAEASSIVTDPESGSPT
jgi:protein-tyrosine phosphatase